MTDYTVITSRVRLARNLAEVRFPSRINAGEVEKVYRAAFSAAKEVFDPTLYQIGSLSEEEKCYLVERHLISPMLAESPYGGVILSKDRQLSVMLLEEDHIRSQCFRKGLALEDAFASLKEYDLALRAKCRLAYDKKIGYLTACPTNVGTGMRASVLMFLPGIALNAGLNDLVEELKAAGLTIRGALGEGSEGDGFCYQISNAVSLGVSEETILNRVSSAAEKINHIEKNLLQKYYQQNRNRLEDSVARAVAILSSAKLLSQEELESLIVSVKIGVILGLVDMDHVNLDDLALLCKPYSLVRLTECENTSEARDFARARTVRKTITDKE
ncbi:MAG TPA: ATP--guanido phosphotransferase [Clostridiales bacterium]|nr:ATP--guanido phosphotransferase [Clostridiales bacterium]